MSKRKAIPVRVQVSVAIRQANNTEHTLLLCPLCKVVLWEDDPRVLEHMTPHATMVALGKDPDAIDNLRWVHAECAARKTNGTKATCADGDTHKIAKAKRIAKARQVHEAVLRGEHRREPSKIANRGWPKGWRRKVNRSVERV